MNTPFESSDQHVSRSTLRPARVAPTARAARFRTDAVALLVALLVAALLAVAAPAYTDTSATNGADDTASTAEDAFTTTGRTNDPACRGLWLGCPGTPSKTTTT